MKRIFWVLFCILSMPILASLIPAGQATESNLMWIEPSELILAESTTSTKFNVTIALNTTTPASAWQFYIVYNKAHFRALRCDYTGHEKSMWAGPFKGGGLHPVFDGHNDTHNFVLFGENLGSPANRTGTGSLAWIEFVTMPASFNGEIVAGELRIDIDGVFSSFVLDSELESTALSFGRATYSYTGNVFALAQTSLVIVPSSHGTTSPPSGVYNYEIGSSVTVAATPETDYTLHHWELDGHNIGATSPIIVSLNTNHTLRAVFAVIEDRVRMYLEPANISDMLSGLSVGTRFNITVWLDTTRPVHAWQFFLLYDKTFLEATRAGYSGEGKSLWAEDFRTWGVSPCLSSHDATRGFVLYGEGLVKDGTKTGLGSLAWVEFKIKEIITGGNGTFSQPRIDVNDVFSSGVIDPNCNPLALTFGNSTGSSTTLDVSNECRDSTSVEKGTIDDVDATQKSRKSAHGLLGEANIPSVVPVLADVRLWLWYVLGAFVCAAMLLFCCSTKHQRLQTNSPLSQESTTVYHYVKRPHDVLTLRSQVTE